MTAKISKWGNSAAIRLPKEIMDALALHVGDKIEISQQNNRVVITHVDEKNIRLVEEAKRIKAHAKREYELLEGSLDDGLNAL
ncbi:MAG: AbrB/MazE/SpoVT family DNA-binding domain-containing protein [Campylobacterales bacterium]|nr:AbrB/MazE/SpoVT family DNA-binding domain-containing protein [Campylobacterales bacterium]